MLLFDSDQVLKDFFRLKGFWKVAFHVKCKWLFIYPFAAVYFGIIYIQLQIEKRLERRKKKI